MDHIGIIGSGITGLTLAWKFLRDGYTVTVWEASERTGGAIVSDREGEWLAEGGPNSIQDSDASVQALIDSVGLTDRLLEASTAAKRRYIVRDGKPVLVPNSLFSAITTPLFSLGAKLGILAEPFRGRPAEYSKGSKSDSNANTGSEANTSPDSGSNANLELVSGSNSESQSATDISSSIEPEETAASDETLASFVRRRLGPEFLDYAINPMVGGIYAGNPEHLSVRHAFPKIKALEDEFGSLVKGAIGRSVQAARGKIKRHRKRVLSFPDGLSELTQALTQKLGDRIITSATVHSIHRVESNGKPSFTIQYGQNEDSAKTATCDRLIFAGTTHGLKNIALSGFKSSNGTTASETIRYLTEKVRYAPVHSVTLGYRRAQVQHPLDGFGVLIPEKEPFRILGCLFTSSIFPHRAPSDGVTLTVFIGGMRRPELTTLDDEALTTVVKADLETLLGVEGEPDFLRIYRWHKAIPQYETGYGAILDLMNALEKANPGFTFAGNYKTGISLDACIRAAWNFDTDYA